jgi:glycerol uptake facilitator-like aquaporin
VIHPMAPQKATMKDVKDMISAKSSKGNDTNSQEASFAEEIGTQVLIVLIFSINAKKKTRQNIQLSISIIALSGKMEHPLRIVCMKWNI